MLTSALRGTWGRHRAGDRAGGAPIGQILGPAFPQKAAVDAIANLIEADLARRESGESFIETYRRLGAAPLKGAVHAIVSLARFVSGSVSAAAGNVRLGVRLHPVDSVGALAPWIGMFALVAADMPRFRAGRAFSQAQSLREQYVFLLRRTSRGQRFRSLAGGSRPSPGRREVRTAPRLTY